MGASDKSFLIEIETEADLKRLEAYQRDLENAEKAAKEMGLAHDELTKKLESVDKALQSTQAKTIQYAAALERVKQAEHGNEAFEKQLYGLEVALSQIGGKARIASEGIFQVFNSARGFQNITEALSGMAESGLLPIVGAAAAGVAILETLKHSIEEFAGAEERMTKVDSALAQKGLFSEENREQIIALGEELQETTKIAAGQWMPVIARLIQFGADNSNIEEYTTAVKNLAGVMGGDIEGAAHIFTRVMSGNVEILKRYGIHIAEGETSTETLNNAMEQLARVGGGQLEAQGRTLNGMFRGLKNEISDTFESIGAGIAKTGLLQNALQLTTDVLSAFKDHFKTSIPPVEGMANAMGGLAKKTLDSKEAMEEFKKALEASKIATDNAIKSWAVHGAMLKDDLDTQYKLLEIQRELEKIELSRAERAGEITKEDAAEANAKLDAAGKQAELDKQIAMAELTKRDAADKANAADYAARVAQQQYEASRKKEEDQSSPAAVAARRKAELEGVDAELKRQAGLPEKQPFHVSSLFHLGIGSNVEIQDTEKIAQLQRHADALRKMIGPVDTSGKAAPELAAADAAKQAEERKTVAEEAKKAADAANKEAERTNNEQNNKIENLRKIKEAQDRLDAEKTVDKTEEGRKKDEESNKKLREQRMREIEQDNRKRGLQPGNPSYRDPNARGAGAGEDVGSQTLSQVVDPFQQYHEATMGAIDALGDQVKEARNQMLILEERFNNDRLV